jgi:rhodanese-related sulfurtransferase
MPIPHRIFLLILAISIGTLARVNIAVSNEREAGSNAEARIVTPAQIEGVTNVDAEGLIEKVMNTPELVLIDSRITADRKEGYIEGSVSLPDIDTTCDSLEIIAPAREIPVMFYCNGIKCGRGAKAAKIALGCEYTDVYLFSRGMEEWQEKQYPLVQ